MARDVENALPYVLHIRAEHRRLREALRRILTLFPQREEPSPEAALSPEQLVDKLSALRRDLAHHFAEEESGGCLDEATARCPSLLPETRAIEAEHETLMDELDGIIERARGCRPPGCTAEMARRFRTFARSLYSHEAAENRVLGQAFGGEFDVDDVE